MKFHRIGRHLQLSGDAFVRGSGGYQSQNLALARRQSRRAALDDQIHRFGNGGAVADCKALSAEAGAIRPP